MEIEKFHEIPAYFRHVKPPVQEVYWVGTMLPSKRIAIIGSREINDKQKTEVSELAALLVSYDYAIVSGLALGTDTAAHQGALKDGQTVAVLGSGFKQITPKENIPLAREICRKGGLISEHAPDTEVKGYQLAQRNRLIAALSAGVIIFASKAAGGSIYTVRDAFRLGKPVYTNEQSEAGKILLNEPATCLPNLLKQFDITKKEATQLKDEPLAKPIETLFRS